MAAGRQTEADENGEESEVDDVDMEDESEESLIVDDFGGLDKGNRGFFKEMKTRKEREVQLDEDGVGCSYQRPKTKFKRLKKYETGSHKVDEEDGMQQLQSGENELEDSQDLEDDDEMADFIVEEDDHSVRGKKRKVQEIERRQLRIGNIEDKGRSSQMPLPFQSLDNFPEERYMTEKDETIRDTDMPERLQVLWETLPDVTTDATKEAEWIYNKISGCYAALDSDKEEVVKEITNILRLLHADKVEVPFIGVYRKEQCLHFIEEADDSSKLRRYKALWEVQHWDNKWFLLEKRKEKLQAAYNKHSGKRDAENQELLEKLLQTLADAQSEQAVDDVDAKFNLLFPTDECEAPHFKRPKRRSLYSVHQKAGFGNVTKYFGLNSRQFGENLQSFCKKHEIEDPLSAPEEVAAGAVGGDFGDPQTILSGARHMAVVEISMEPAVRQHIRNAYLKKTTVTTKPTLEGSRVIDSCHQYASVKWLLEKPLAMFDDAQWLLIEKAEKEKLLVVSLGFQDVGLMQEFEAAYLSEGESRYAELWNEQRKLILQDSLLHFLIPDMEKEMRMVLAGKARQWIASKCEDLVWRWVSTSPYVRQSFEFEGLTKEDDAAPVAACCWSPGKPATFVMLNSAGEFVDTFCTGYLSIRAFSDEQRQRQNDALKQLVRFIMVNKPHVLVIGAMNTQCRFLHKAVKEAIYKVAELHPGDLPTAGIEVFYGDEAVAVVYENSPISKEQLPDHPGNVRRAVALGRYLQNPLAMLSCLCGSAKEILSLKLHPLQHFLNHDELYEVVERVMVTVTNQVGLDVNLAASHDWLFGPLQFVSGLGLRKSVSIRRTIQDVGRVNSRKALLTTLQIMKGNAFLNAAGFLRVRKSGQAAFGNEEMDLLDDTRIHPESYGIAMKMAEDAYCKELGKPLAEVNAEALQMAVQHVRENPNTLMNIDIDEYASTLKESGFDKDVQTLQDIKMGLVQGYVEIRRKFEPPNEEDVFFWSTGESPDTIRIGRPVNVVVRKVLSKGVICALESGTTGMLQKDELEHEVVEGSALSCIIVGVNCEFMSVELKSCQSGAEYESDTVTHDEYNKPDEAYLLDLKEKAKTKIEEGKQKLIKHRVIVHPLFRNISMADAVQALAERDAGEVIVFPSTRGPSFLSLLMKVCDGVNSHIEILERGKDAKDAVGLLRIGKFLKIYDETFEGLDEVAARFVDPYANNLRKILQYRKFKTGTSKEVEELLRSEKSENPARIPYYVSVCYDRPGAFTLSYLRSVNPDHEYVTISSKGYKFRGRIFDSPDKFVSYFQRHIDDAPQPQLKQENDGPWNASGTTGRGGKGRGCFSCGEDGHMSRDCPNKASGGGDKRPGTCYSCGEEGHMSRDCPNKASDGGDKRPGTCYSCGEDGHMSRDCPNKSSGGGDKRPGTCYSCGEAGHMSRDCPNKASGGGDKRTGTCYSCGEEGHMSRDCPNKRGGGRGGSCFSCGEEGHLSRDCPNKSGLGTGGGGGGGGWGNNAGDKTDGDGWGAPVNADNVVDDGWGAPVDAGNVGADGWGNGNGNNGGEQVLSEAAGWGDGNGNNSGEQVLSEAAGWGGGADAETPPGQDNGGPWKGSADGGGGRGRSGGGCFSCGEEGHKSRECPKKASGGGGGRAGTCYSCGGEGHMSRECPNKSSGGGRRGVCFSCGEEGHMSRECPNKAGMRRGDGGGNAGHKNGGETVGNIDGGWGNGNEGLSAAAGWGGGADAVSDATAERNDDATRNGGEGGWGNTGNDDVTGNGGGWGKTGNAGDSTGGDGAWGSMSADDGWGRNEIEGGGKAGRDNKADTGGGSWGRSGVSDDNNNNWKTSGMNASGNGGGRGDGCYSCGEQGHMSRDCPSKGSSGGRRGGGCFACGEEGHMSRDCPTKSAGGGGSCYSCGEQGHMSRECPTKAAGGGGSRSGCYSCGEQGHMSRECPTKAAGGGSRGGCYACGEQGHMSRDCPTRGGGVGCFSCGEQGHRSRDCPNKTGGNGGNATGGAVGGGWDGAGRKADKSLGDNTDVSGGGWGAPVEAAGTGGDGWD